MLSISSSSERKSLCWAASDDMEDSQPQPFIYRAKYKEVISAQTIVLTLDMGLRIQKTIHGDLIGITANCPHGEGDDAERKKGQHEARFVRSWLNGNALDSDSEWPLLARTYLPRDECERGDYGVKLFSRDSEACLNADLKERFPRVVA